MTIREEVEGSLVTADSLYLNCEYPTGCSVSQVGLTGCGNPISKVVTEIDQNSDFMGNTVVKALFPDYSVQIVRIRVESFKYAAYSSNSVGSGCGSGCAQKETQRTTWEHFRMHVIFKLSALEYLDGKVIN